MPATQKPVGPKPTTPEAPTVNHELELFKRGVFEKINDRYAKLTEASKNATNVWDRLNLEYRIQELTDIYKLIMDIK